MFFVVSHTYLPHEIFSAISTHFGVKCVGTMEGTSNKCSRSQKHYSNTFKTKKVKKLYANRFKQRAVLAERGVTCADFTGKQGLWGSEYSARRPCLKGHPISTEISYLMPSDSAQCCSSSSSHSPTCTNPRRQTLLSRPRTRSSKVYFQTLLLLASIVNCYACPFLFFSLFLSFEVLVPHFKLEIVCFDHFSFMLCKDFFFFTVLMSILGFRRRRRR
jgi:hypothetical protein